MSDPANDLELVKEEAQIKKTASYNTTKSGFNIAFLQNILSVEIKRLVELQSNTISLLETMIEEMKKKPLNGGSE